MASTVTEVPSFEFSAFYYPQLLEALLIYKRINVPELTDESDEEVSIQLLRAIALVGHLNNVTIDIVANESTLPTAQLPETVRNMLRLIDYELKPATPAAADIVYRLARTFATPLQLVPVEGQLATRSSGSDPVVYFEALQGVSIDRTDQLGAVFLEATSGVFVDRTAAANAGTVSNYNLPAGGNLYFGHTSIMWDKINFAISSVAPYTVGVWEFYDGDTSDTRPDSVATGLGILSFDLTTLLGSSNRAGAVVRIRFNTSTTFEDVISTWDGVKNVAQTTLLGQSTPSLIPSDYTVGTNWQELDSITDGTALLDATGDLSFLLPQTLERNWQKTVVNGFTGFFIRFRVVSTTVGSGPTIGRIRIDTGKQYATARATQGRTASSETLGSSNGTQNQRFSTAQNGFILGSQEVRVDGQAWTLVKDFLSSGPGDKHYRIELGDKDVANIVFGDGVTGFIPAIGQGNLVIDYRWGASDDGNVGAQTLVVDKQGLTYVEAIYNPRTATGWAEAEANSPASLARAKVAGPASLRIKEVALSPDDLVTLAQAFTDSGGSKPFGRAFAIEESFGPKTVELVCVGRGGVQVDTGTLAELSTYFNGDKFAIPPQPKHFVANQQVVSTNFTPHPINIVATVFAPDSIVAEQVRNQLASVLQPEALNDDGVTYTWAFGGDVPVSRIIHEIFQTDPSITNVNLISPAVDEALGVRELPTAGTLSITMISNN